MAFSVTSVNVPSPLLKIHPVGAVIAGEIDVLPAVVIEVPVADVERPAGMFREAGLLRRFDEMALSIVLPERDAAAVDGVIEIVRQHVRATSDRADSPA